MMRSFSSSQCKIRYNSEPRSIASVENYYYYSAQNDNWDWKFEVCLFSRPTLSSALDITRYQQVTTIQIVFSLRCNELYYFICKQFFPGQLALG